MDGGDRPRRIARTLCVFAEKKRAAGAPAPFASSRQKKSRPKAALFGDWGVAHSCWAVRLTDTPSVQVSPATKASGTVNVTVPFSPTVAEASAAGAPFTVKV